jgi:phage-related protein
MPAVEVIFYADDRGVAPLIRHFDLWPRKVIDKCYVRIERLAFLGSELRRPEADFLREGIYELRVRHLNVNYRILYFFHQNSAVLFDGLTKEGVIPVNYFDKALRAKAAFVRDPENHTYKAGSHDD